MRGWGTVAVTYLPHTVPLESCNTSLSHVYRHFAVFHLLAVVQYRRTRKTSRMFESGYLQIAGLLLLAQIYGRALVSCTSVAAPGVPPPSGRANRSGLPTRRNSFLLLPQAPNPRSPAIAVAGSDAWPTRTITRAAQLAGTMKKARHPSTRSIS